MASSPEASARFQDILQASGGVNIKKIGVHTGNRLRVSRQLLSSSNDVVHLDAPIDHTIVFQLGGHIGVERYYNGVLDAKISSLKVTTIIPAHMENGWRIDEEVDVLHFCIDHSVLSRLVDEDLNMDSRSLEIIDTIGADDSFMKAMASLALEEINSSYPFSKLMLDSFDLIMASHLLRAYSNYSDKAKTEIREDTRFSKENSLIEKAKQFIDEQLDDPPSMLEVADHIGMSQFQFLRSFKALLGETPHRYLLGRKLYKARELLENTNYSISHIAYECGFSSQSHLTTALKKYLGVTPARYRDQTQA